MSFLRKTMNLGSDVTIQEIMEECDRLGIDASTVKLDGYVEDSYGEVRMSWSEDDKALVRVRS